MGVSKAEARNRELPEGVAIEVRDLQVELSGAVILSGVNARIPEGAVSALIGPNGAGKTTLLLAILGIIPYQGKIKVRCGKGAHNIGYVPQHLDFDRGMPVTVMDFLCMGSQRSPLWLSRLRNRKKHALEVLARVKADHVAGRMLGNISGGEFQRVLLAMALMEEPSILLLDEPASAVDRNGEQLFMNLVKSLNEEQGLTMLMVSHDISMVTRLAEHVICLNREVLSEGNTADVINESTLSACFGADKGLMLHDHHWGEDVTCAFEPLSDEESHNGD
ncbi:MAG: metal ABC transporter ATP-binding protein [bacterium]